MCRRSAKTRETLVARQKKLGDPPSLGALISADPVPDPNRVVDRLLLDSPAYADLYRRAEEAVGGELGHGLVFVTHKKGGAAYYDQEKGEVSISTTQGAPTAVLNVVFETANACQAPMFARVHRDWLERRTFDETAYAQYGVDAGEIPAHSTHDGSPEFHCAMIREMLEWNTFRIARDAFLSIAGSFGEGSGKDAWDMSFGEILLMPDFATYYQEKGRLHRNTVQTNLKIARQKEDEKKKK